MLTDGTIQTLIALAEAYEGRIEMKRNGVLAVRTDDSLEVYIDMEDGRTLRPQEADERVVNEAIMQWREQNHTYFQKILGAMM